MTNSSDKPNAELEQLAKKLDGYAEKFAELIDPVIPCWIMSEELRSMPTGADLARDRFRWADIKTLNEEPRRIVWLYRDDLQPANPLQELLEGLGEDLASLSEHSKAIVYVGWCKHFLSDSRDKISSSLEALFSEPFWLRPRLSEQLEAERLGIIDVKLFSDGHTETCLKNFAEAASYFSIALATRLRTASQPLYPSDEGEFCCSVAREEERCRRKKPEEILPIIQKLKMRWKRADDPSPYGIQQLIDDLWADMIPLGWELPPCPTLCKTGSLAFLRDRPAHKKLWREYHAALTRAVQTARRHLSVTSGSLTANKIGELLTKASGADSESDISSAEAIEAVGNTTNRQEDEMPTLSQRQYLVLQVLSEMGAVTADKREKAQAIAQKAEGSQADVNGFKEPIADLRARGFLDSKEGRGGGSWLTISGQSVAEKL